MTLPNPTPHGVPSAYTSHTSPFFYVDPDLDDDPILCAICQIEITDLDADDYNRMIAEDAHPVCLSCVEAYPLYPWNHLTDSGQEAIE